MQTNGEINKGDANQEKSKPSRLETNIIKCEPIKSSFLPFLDPESYSNLRLTNRNIYKEIKEVKDEQRLFAHEMYSTYIKYLSRWTAALYDFLLDYESILKSDFERLYNMISEKSSEDQKKFYFDTSTTIISPAFKSYLEMCMMKTIFLELSSITEEDFLAYGYRNNSAMDMKYLNDVEKLSRLQKTLYNMIQNSREKRVSKIFDMIVRGQKFEAKTFWDEMRNDKKYAVLLANRKNQHRDTFYIANLWRVISRKLGGVKIDVSEKSEDGPDVKTIRNIFEQVKVDGQKIFNDHRFSYMLNHPRKSEGQVFALFPGYYDLRVFIDYLLQHLDHENATAALLLACARKRERELDGECFGQITTLIKRVPGDNPNYKLICSLLEDKKSLELEDQDLGSIIVCIGSLVLYLLIALVCLWRILSASFLIGCLSVLPLFAIALLMNLATTIFVLDYFVPWISKLIYDRGDKILIDKARSTADQILNQLDQNQQANKGKLENQKGFSNENLTNVPAVENKINKVEDKID